MENNPLISVVTVCYKVAHELPATMESVINQTYKNIEYIIIDGGSKDNSVEIIKKYEKIALEKGILFKWVSESDKGIYDAMNKGIDLATGEWINFMNAGDSFYSSCTVFDIFNNKNNKGEILYGDVNLNFDGFFLLTKPKKINDFWKGMVIFHQSTFTALKYHKENPFNIKYKIASDFDFFYRAFKENIKFKYIPVVISTFAADGISLTNAAQALKEDFYIVRSHGLSLKCFSYYLYRFFYQKVAGIVKFLLPIKIVNYIRSCKWE